MTRKLQSRDTPIDGVKIITRTVLNDSRGSFARLFCAEELAQFGWLNSVAQINCSKTLNPGTVRGMHYQRGAYAEDKLVSCVAGSVWDVVVDLRPHSASYLRWFAQELSVENAQAMLIPKGVAHGFQALKSESMLVYVHSSPHAHTMEAGLRVDDPTINIAWPLPLRDWSERDQKLPLYDVHLEPFYP